MRNLFINNEGIEEGDMWPETLLAYGFVRPIRGNGPPFEWFFRIKISTPFKVRWDPLWRGDYIEEGYLSYALTFHVWVHPSIQGSNRGFRITKQIHPVTKKNPRINA